jgi:hypothetical protein
MERNDSYYLQESNTLIKYLEQEPSNIFIESLVEPMFYDMHNYKKNEKKYSKAFKSLKFLDNLNTTKQTLDYINEKFNLLINKIKGEKENDFNNYLEENIKIKNNLIEDIVSLKEIQVRSKLIEHLFSRYLILNKIVSNQESMFVHALKSIELLDKNIIKPQNKKLHTKTHYINISEALAANIKATKLYLNKLKNEIIKLNTLQNNTLNNIDVSNYKQWISKINNSKNNKKTKLIEEQNKTYYNFMHLNNVYRDNFYDYKPKSYKKFTFFFKNFSPRPLHISTIAIRQKADLDRLLIEKENYIKKLNEELKDVEDPSESLIKGNLNKIEAERKLLTQLTIQYNYLKTIMEQQTEMLAVSNVKQKKRLHKHLFFNDKLKDIEILRQSLNRIDTAIKKTKADQDVHLMKFKTLVISAQNNSKQLNALKNKFKALKTNIFLTDKFKNNSNALETLYEDFHNSKNDISKLIKLDQIRKKQEQLINFLNASISFNITTQCVKLKEELLKNETIISETTKKILINDGKNPTNPQAYFNFLKGTLINNLLEIDNSLKHKYKQLSGKQHQYITKYKDTPFLVNEINNYFSTLYNSFSIDIKANVYRIKNLNNYSEINNMLTEIETQATQKNEAITNITSILESIDFPLIEEVKQKQSLIETYFKYTGLDEEQFHSLQKLLQGVKINETDKFQEALTHQNNLLNKYRPNGNDFYFLIFNEHKEASENQKKAKLYMEKISNFKFLNDDFKNSYYTQYKEMVKQALRIESLDQKKELEDLKKSQNNLIKAFEQVNVLKENSLKINSFEELNTMFSNLENKIIRNSNNLPFKIEVESEYDHDTNDDDITHSPENVHSDGEPNLNLIKKIKAIYKYSGFFNKFSPNLFKTERNALEKILSTQNRSPKIRETDRCLLNSLLKEYKTIHSKIDQIQKRSDAIKAKNKDSYTEFKQQLRINIAIDSTKDKDKINTLKEFLDETIKKFNVIIADNTKKGDLNALKKPLNGDERTKNTKNTTTNNTNSNQHKNIHHQRSFI